MKHKTQKAIGLSLFTMFAIQSLAVADSVATRSTMKVEQESAPMMERPLHFFGGVGFGYSAMYSKGISRGNADGTELELSLLSSYMTKALVFDLGVGWMYNQISGKIQPGGRSEVSTRAGFAELSPRLRLSERWQLGAVADGFYGTDVHFGPDVNHKNYSVLAGPIAVYQLPLKDVEMRFWTKLMTDIDVQDRRMHTLVAGIQIGLGVGGKKTTRLVQEPIQVAQAAPERKSLHIEISKELVHFKTGKSELNKNAKAYLAELGRVLATKQAAFDAIEVSGHTDERGSDAYNQKLSDARAAAVRTELAKSGLSPEKLAGKGFGKYQPLVRASNPVAWAKNRRVELEFQNAHDDESLISAIKDLSAKYSER